MILTNMRIFNLLFTIIMLISFNQSFAQSNTKKPEPPPPKYVEEEVFDFFPFYENPEMLPGSIDKVKEYTINNYPTLAAKCGVSGNVIVKFIVNKEGIPESLDAVLEKPMDMGFGEVAIKAVEQIRFKPATQREEPISVIGTIKVHFKAEH